MGSVRAKTGRTGCADLGLADLIDQVPLLLKVLDIRLHYDGPPTFLHDHQTRLSGRSTTDD